jgi:hypothetical protein
MHLSVPGATLPALPQKRRLTPWIGTGGVCCARCKEGWGSGATLLAPRSCTGSWTSLKTLLAGACLLPCGSGRGIEIKKTWKLNSAMCRRLRMKRNYKFQMYQQPSKGVPAAHEEVLQNPPIALPGLDPHLGLLCSKLAASVSEIRKAFRAVPFGYLPDALHC